MGRPAPVGDRTQRTIVAVLLAGLVFDLCVGGLVLFGIIDLTGDEVALLVALIKGAALLVIVALHLFGLWRRNGNGHL